MSKEDQKSNAHAFGLYLASLRAKLDMSLRAVEEATDKEVSNAYLSQLEKGKIEKPSPDILYSLSEAYGVSYEGLMERAGYLGHKKKRADNEKHGMAATFAIDNLSKEEEEVLLDYLNYIRTRKKE